MQYSLYLAPPACAALVFVCLGLYALRYRRVPGALAFAVCMLLGAHWALFYTLDLVHTELAAKAFWARFRFPAIALVPVAWLALSAQFTNRSDLLTRRRLGALLVVPVLTSVLALTSGSHRLFFAGYQLFQGHGLTTLILKRGPWYQVHWLYTYALMTACFVLLGRSMRTAHGWYRRQTILVLLGLAAPMASDIFFVLGITPIPGYSLTSTALLLSGILMGWALFRYRLFEVVPIGRHLVVESMADLMLIVDGQGRVVDINPAAQRALGVGAPQAFGRKVEDYLADWPAVLDGQDAGSHTHLSMHIATGEGRRLYDVLVSPINDRRGRPIGRMVLLRDVTERELARQAFVEREKRRALLEAQEAERRHLARELHDEIGQGLTGLKLTLHLAGRVPEPQRAARLAQAIEISSQLMGQVRALSLRLRPHALDDLGLLAALQANFARFTSHTRVEIDFRHSGLEQRFPAEIEIAAYRIVQEALTNVSRHAGVQRATVRAWATDTDLWLQVEDAGKGFDSEGAVSTGTTGGLGGMHERTALLGGRLTIDSAPGQGTRIAAALPLSDRPRSDDAGQGSRPVVIDEVCRTASYRS